MGESFPLRGCLLLKSIRSKLIPMRQKSLRLSNKMNLLTHFIYKRLICNINIEFVLLKDSKSFLLIRCMNKHLFVPNQINCNRKSQLLGKISLSKVMVSKKIRLLMSLRLHYQSWILSIFFDTQNIQLCFLFLWKILMLQYWR